MAEEKTYNIPLRKEFQKAPKYKRAKKAIAAVKKFLVRHTKSENIKIGTKLNQEIWKNGIRNPPHHVKVNVKKEEDVVTAELIGNNTIEAKVEDKKTSKTKKVEKTETKAPKVDTKNGVKEKTVEQKTETSKPVQEPVTKVEEKKVTEKTETKNSDVKSE